MDVLVQLVTEAITGLPLRGQLENVPGTEQIRGLLRAFRREFIPSMMIDVALIKAMVDCDEAARRSRFSAVAARP